METVLAFLLVLLAPVLLIPFAFIAYLTVGSACAAVKMRTVDKLVEKKGSHANLGTM